MIVTCSECDTSFNFDEQYIKETGSKVRCSKCRSVFVVYPPSVSDLHAAAAPPDPSVQAPAEASAGLDAVDLSEIEDMLDTDPSTAGTEPSVPQEDTAEFELDLDLEDVGFGDESEPKTDLDETNELDLSGLDLEESPANGLASAEPAEASDDLDFELDLEAVGASDESDATENLDLELDFGETAEPEAPDAENGMEETQSLDLSDMEGIVESDLPGAAVSDVDEAADELDFDIEAAADSDAEAAPAEPAGAVDDFDFELDFSEDGQTPATVDKVAGSDETEELDLSELEDMLEGDEPMSDQGMDIESSDGLDFELDLDALDQAPASAETPEPVMDETVALDVSDLEDLGKISADERPPAEPPDIQESADELELELDLGPESSDTEEAAADIEDSFDLNELDDMLGASDEDSVVDEDALESTDDFDLELDLSDDDADAAVPSDIEAPDDLASTEESDLTDLEGMLDIDETPAAEELASDVEELELDDISLEPATAGPSDLDHTEALQDVELAFDADEPEAEAAMDLEGMDTIESGAEEEEEEVADTFDMGTLTAEGQPSPKEPPGGTDMPDDMAAAMPPPRRRISAPFRILLVLVLIIGGGIGTLSLLDFMGLGINMKEIGRNIPLVGDLFKPKYPDKGNLKMAIIEKMVKYDIVENANSGALLIIEGKIRNTYDHPRSFIKVTGKLYDRRKKLAGKKTVYAGNIIPSEALATMDTGSIDKQLRNRFGNQRVNVKVQKGRMVPFMIVFSSLPQDLDEFTVEVAGSTQTRG